MDKAAGHAATIGTPRTAELSMGSAAVHTRDLFAHDPFSGIDPRRGVNAAGKSLITSKSRKARAVAAVAADGSCSAAGRADVYRCDQCAGAGVQRVERVLVLAHDWAAMLLGICCCLAAYTTELAEAALLYIVTLLCTGIRVRTDKYLPHRNV